MPTDAIVTLEQLRCITLKNTESRTEPYIWPALIRIDDNTLSTTLIDMSVPILGNARVVIKDSMRAGENAAIPPSVGIMRARFDDNLSTRHLLLVVALLENDETPKKAMQSGFKAFASELRAALDLDTLVALSAADEEQQKPIVKAIQERVTAKVKSATRDALSAWEKTKVFAGSLNLDDPMGSDFKHLVNGVLTATSFTLNFETKADILPGPGVVEAVTKYEIQGGLRLQPVAIDLCKDLVNAVIVAQGVVNGIEEQIKNLQAQLSGGGDEPSLPKDFILDEIDRLREEELAPAVAALAEARAALQACRDRFRRFQDVRVLDADGIQPVLR